MLLQEGKIYHAQYLLGVTMYCTLLVGAVEVQAHLQFDLLSQQISLFYLLTRRNFEREFLYDFY